MTSALPLTTDIAKILRHVRFVPTSEVGQRHLAHRNDASRSYSAESNVLVRNANGAASKVELGACLAVPEHAAVVADPVRVRSTLSMPNAKGCPGLWRLGRDRCSVATSCGQLINLGTIG